MGDYENILAFLYSLSLSSSTVLYLYCFLFQPLRIGTTKENNHEHWH